MSKEINMTCIMCPMGCQLTARHEGKEIKVSGNTCVRGEHYAREEIISPKRIVTALVRTTSGVLPVKTTSPIPKAMIFDVVNEINKLTIKRGKMGDVIIKNIFGTGADIVITGNNVDYDI